MLGPPRWRRLSRTPPGPAAAFVRAAMPNCARASEDPQLPATRACRFRRYAISTRAVEAAGSRRTTATRWCPGAETAVRGRAAHLHTLQVESTAGGDLGRLELRTSPHTRRAPGMIGRDLRSAPERPGVRENAEGFSERLSRTRRIAIRARLPSPCRRGGETGSKRRCRRTGSERLLEPYLASLDSSLNFLTSDRGVTGCATHETRPPRSVGNRSTTGSMISRRTTAGTPRAIPNGGLRGRAPPPRPARVANGCDPAEPGTAASLASWRHPAAKAIASAALFGRGR